jgi:hypothetical protein
VAHADGGGAEFCISLPRTKPPVSEATEDV